jgi:peptidoglycan/xylan/chitin deacetylase (PgdA/CDA1 family)
MTFDDLPHTPNDGSDPSAVSLGEAAESNRRILAALRRYRAPATGFVNERHIQTIGPRAARLLAGWNRGDYKLANHGANHADANTLDAAGIEREIVEGEATIRPLAERAGRKVRFFRFPFNHRGETAEKQAAVQSFLTARGYWLAASTIDTSDYIYDAAFQRALRERDRPMEERIKRAYLDHTARQIEYYAGLNRQALGEEPPAIMLLHVNRLNAATMQAQLAVFRKAGYRFVSLAEAQAHPVYAEPPRGVTRFGPMWGYRWARDRGVKFDGDLEQEPPVWVVNYGTGKAP